MTPRGSVPHAQQTEPRATPTKLRILDRAVLPRHMPTPLLVILELLSNLANGYTL
jgi:hypothetical protein